MKKLLAGILAAAATVLALPAVAFAHVVVTPNQASVGDRVLFTVSVPNEKEVAVSSVKLDIPTGVEDVQPNVIAGWGITTEKDSDGNVTSITWTGTIPVGQRADLVFKAQTPAKATELDWKAYQTYADGSVVHWDQKPSTEGDKDDDSSDTGPYSVTQVVDDLSSDTATTTGNSSKQDLAFVFSIAALALSLGSLFLRRRK